MNNQLDVNYASYQSPETIAVYDAEPVKAIEMRVFEKYFQKPGDVLDIGCGTGRTSRVLARLGHRVDAVDYSQTMIAHAMAKGDREVTYRVMDVRSLAYPDGRFPYVLFSFNGVDYLCPERERSRALSEIYRVLAPGGIFAFSSHNACFIPNTLYRLWVVLRSFLNGCVHPYRLEFHPFGTLLTHYSSPKKIMDELAQHGFVLKEIVSKYGIDRKTITWRDPYPMYVCTK